MSLDSDFGLGAPLLLFAQRTSRHSAKKNSWNQISDFFKNSIIPEFDDTLLIDAVEDCAEWKRYVEHDIDDIEILYERFDGRGKVLSTYSDEDNHKVHEEAANFELQGKLWVLSGLHQAPTTGRRAKFQFPLPQGDGLKRLNTLSNFEIPWNIYCPTVADERNIVKWKHTLKRNQWLVDNPFKDQRTWEMCRCTGTSCGSRCINRSLQHECSPYNCNFGSSLDCGNRPFTNLIKNYHEHKKYATAYEVVKTEHKGYGLFSVRPYNVGSLIVEYTGEVFDMDEVEHRLNTIYKDVENHYFLGLEGSLVVDAGQKGSVARFANHSCEPNAEMQKWYVNDEPRIGLFVKKPIEAGEEVTYDYNFECLENAELQKCFCGSKLCRGFIGKRADRGDDDESEDEPISKRASRPVSKPLKSTTRADSPSVGLFSSDSEYENPDVLLGNRLLDAINNHDISSSDSEPAEDDSHSMPEPKPKSSHGSKYRPGVKMKASVVEDEPLEKPSSEPNKKTEENGTIERSPSDAEGSTEALTTSTPQEKRTELVRASTSRSNSTSQPRKRKRVIKTDDEDEDEIPAVLADVQAKRANKGGKNDVNDVPENSLVVTGKPLEIDVKLESKSPNEVPKSRRLRERYYQKKPSVFSKRRNSSAAKKPSSEKLSDDAKPAAKVPSPGPSIFSLKKSKRKGPTQTTETYDPSVNNAEIFKPMGNELVLVEHEQQPSSQHYQYRDGWQQPYYDEHEPHYEDQYYPVQSYPQPILPQPIPHPHQVTALVPHTQGEQLKVNKVGNHPPPPPPPPQNYHYYPPHYKGSRPYQPMYYPPAPRGYYQPPPPRQYLGGMYYPPPQRHVVHGGQYYPEYHDGHTAYPPGAFTVDAEPDETLVAESFADDVLQQPDKEKQEAPNRKEPAVTPVVDPRKRKR